MATPAGTTNDNSYDVLILGGGPGGTRAAYLLAKAGKRVALIANDLGGECLNYGCIPTKTYLWTAELYEKMQNSDILGLHLGSAPQIQWNQLQKRRTDVVNKLKKGLKFKLEQSKVVIKEGTGKLKDIHTIEMVDTGEVLHGEFLVLAMGSWASMIPGFEKNERILTNREILDIPEIPKNLLVIGGGAVGVEFASLFAALGSRVTISEAADRLLPGEDFEISAELERIFARRNIEILKNMRMRPDQVSGYDKILVATGRKPTISPEVTEIGVLTDVHGVPTDDHMRTNISSIFAIGDMAGKAYTAYTADREGEIVAETILNKKPSPLAYDIVVNTIFCMPEVASVGLREQQLKEKNIPYKSGKALFSGNAKALIVDNRDGFAKVLVDTTSDKILGIHIIGEKASEIIAEASLSINANLTYSQFAKSIHSHPILGEILKDACDQLIE